MKRLKTLADCRTTRLTMLAITCCLISISIPLTIRGAWSLLPECAAIAGGALLLCWLLWCALMLFKGHTPEPAVGKLRTVLSVSNYALALCWIACSAFPSLCQLWMVQASWMVFAICVGYSINQRLDRDAREHKEA